MIRRTKLQRIIKLIVRRRRALPQVVVKQVYSADRTSKISYLRKLYKTAKRNPHITVKRKIHTPARGLTWLRRLLPLLKRKKKAQHRRRGRFHPLIPMRLRAKLYLRNMLRKRYMKFIAMNMGLKFIRSQKPLLSRFLDSYLAMKFFLRHRTRSRKYQLKKTRKMQLPILRISKTLHNIFFNVLGPDRKLIYTSSLYALAPKTEKNKQSPESFAIVAAKVAKVIKTFQSRNIYVQLYSRLNSRINGFLRSLIKTQGVYFTSIQDLARGPHNGLRPKKSRNQRR